MMACAKCGAQLPAGSAFCNACGASQVSTTAPTVSASAPTIPDLAKPPAAKGRNIASMVAHIHNVRLMWLKAAGATELPQKLESETFTKQQAVRALEASWKALEDTLASFCRETQNPLIHQGLGPF